MLSAPTTYAWMWSIGFPITFDVSTSKWRYAVDAIVFSVGPYSLTNCTLGNLFLLSRIIALLVS